MSVASGSKLNYYSGVGGLGFETGIINLANSTGKRVYRSLRKMDDPKFGLFNTDSITGQYPWHHPAGSVGQLIYYGNNIVVGTRARAL